MTYCGYDVIQNVIPNNFPNVRKFHCERKEKGLFFRTGPLLLLRTSSSRGFCDSSTTDVSEIVAIEVLFLMSPLFIGDNRNVKEGWILITKKLVLKLLDIVFTFLVYTG